MDIKQLVTGDPKTGFYPITQDTITVIELNKAVMNLTNESGSEEIIAAFDNLESFQALIAEVRNPQNICSGILINETPEDKRVGKYEATIIANTDAETLHVRWIEIDKIIALTITNTDGTMSCIRNENNVGGDKTNVLILSLENDLANGQKDSPVEAEVSTALKDAITNGKACVIKSANSDILANLQQISDNVTIVMEQISRIGQTFVAVNTTITVNTATNVISDYQTGAIVLETEGNGNKFLSNDGKYKEIPQPNLSNYLAKNNTTEFTPTGDYNPATKKYVDKNIYYSSGGTPVNNNTIEITNDVSNSFYDFKLDLNNRNITIKLNEKDPSNGNSIRFVDCIFTNVKFNGTLEEYINFTFENIENSLGMNWGLGMPSLYVGTTTIVFRFVIFIDKNLKGYVVEVKRIDPNIHAQKIITESQYAALGTSVNDDNVLYFVTPDA